MIISYTTRATRAYQVCPVVCNIYISVESPFTSKISFPSEWFVLSEWFLCSNYSKIGNFFFSDTMWIAYREVDATPIRCCSLFYWWIKGRASFLYRDLCKEYKTSSWWISSFADDITRWEKCWLFLIFRKNVIDFV